MVKYRDKCHLPYIEVKKTACGIFLQAGFLCVRKVPKGNLTAGADGVRHGFEEPGVPLLECSGLPGEDHCERNCGPQAKQQRKTFEDGTESNL